MRHDLKRIFNADPDQMGGLVCAIGQGIGSRNVDREFENATFTTIYQTVDKALNMSAMLIANQPSRGESLRVVINLPAARATSLTTAQEPEAVPSYWTRDPITSEAVLVTTDGGCDQKNQRRP